MYFYYKLLKARLLIFININIIICYCSTDDLLPFIGDNERLLIRNASIYLYSICTMYNVHIRLYI